MKIYGLNKLTLLDYPGRTACTIFTGGCPLRCPFCHNASLVLCPDTQPLIPPDEVSAFLKKRKNVLEGICITGGEPTLSEDLPDFIKEAKEIGYLVKLDTNGFRPDVIKHLLAENLIDYIAMDIKSSKEKYPAACGISSLDTAPFEASVRLIMDSDTAYEFRTTVTDAFHAKEDFHSIAGWLHGAKAYYLQAFEDSGDLIGRDIGGLSKEDLLEIKEEISDHFQFVGIRGIRL